jgi:hypothetical protein
MGRSGPAALPGRDRPVVALPAKPVVPAPVSPERWWFVAGAAGRRATADACVRRRCLDNAVVTRLFTGRISPTARPLNALAFALTMTRMPIKSD